MIGQSGGRSRRHPAGEDAKRKNTIRERQKIDPPWDEVVPRYRLTEKGEKWASRAEALAIGLMCGGVGVATGWLMGVWFLR